MFQTAGVVVALTFVASPFYLRQAQAAFSTLDRSLLEASRTLGASEARTFGRVACPVAFPSLLSGAALAWGRALGEFGATLVFAGSFQGVTQTAPLAIYAAVRHGLPRRARAGRGARLRSASPSCGGVKLLGRLHADMSGDGLEVTAKAQLGQTELDIAVRVEAGRCLALADRRARARPACCAPWPACCARTRAWCGAATRCGSTPRRGVSCAPDRRRVGYLFQNYALFPHLRGWQNVAYPLRGEKRKERRAHAVELLERFGVGHLADVRPGTYSGGESQRVALARTLARDPMVLLLDEPLSALDARTRASAGRTLKRTLRRQRRSRRSS